MNGVRIIHSETKAEYKRHSVDSNRGKYKISPLIKAMETGFHLSEDISYDYKKEIGEIRTKKYLQLSYQQPFRCRPDMNDLTANFNVT